MKKLFGMLCAGMLVVGLMVGCDDNNDNKSSGTNSTTPAKSSGLVGTWQMYHGDTAQGSPASWYHFQSDGKWFASDTKDGGSHLGGSYTD